jgi:ribosomal protein S14
MDNWRRKIILKYLLKGWILKSQNTFPYSQNSVNLLRIFLKSSLPTTSSQTKMATRCLITGRTHGLFKKTGTSRFIFRTLAYKSSLPSVNRYSR